MADNTIFYANEALFDYILARYYEPIESQFNGTQVDMTLGLYYQFRTVSVPVIDLSPQKGGGNCAIRLNQVEVKTYNWENGHIGDLIDTTVVQVAIAGTLALNGQNIEISSLHTTTEGGQDDRAIAHAMEKSFIPHLQALVQALPLPDFTAVLGVEVEVTSLDVSNRLLKVTARMGTSGEGIAPEWTLETATDATIYAALSTSAVTDLLKANFSGVTKEASAGDSSAGFGYRANAYARAYDPHITIADGVARGTIQGTAGASAGLEAFYSWTDVPISVSMGMPEMGLRLNRDGKKAFIKFYITGSVSLSADLPSILNDIANAVLGMISWLANQVTSGINSVLDNISIEIFDLPDKVPGTDIEATLEFSSLGVSGNSLVTSIVVS